MSQTCNFTIFVLLLYPKFYNFSPTSSGKFVIWSSFMKYRKNVRFVKFVYQRSSNSVYRSVILGSVHVCKVL